MMKIEVYSLLIACIFLPTTIILSQVNDCQLAGVICDNGIISLTSDGPGNDDFASEANNAGCLNEGEHQSAWFYFEFMPNMPPNSLIEFSITPRGNNQEDYDFAIYGPNVSCDRLGTPLRCSFASGDCAFCPVTGLGEGQDDTTEGANGDGFLKPLEVQPGSGYYLFVDNWLASENGFELEWGGSAAGYLNCNADPNCPMRVDVGTDLSVCVNPGPIQLEALVTNATGDLRFEWNAPVDIQSYLSDLNSPNPILQIPNGVVDSLFFTVTVSDETCVRSDQIKVVVSNHFETTIDRPDIFCTGAPAALSVPAGYDHYLWSTGATTPNIYANQSGVYGVTITSEGGCVSMDTVFLEEPFESPGRPEIRGDTVLCIDASVALRVVTGYQSYAWSHGTRNSWYFN